MMRKDGTYEPGDKTRCTNCSRMIQLTRMEQVVEFARYEWRSLDGDTHCRRREIRPHTPRRNVKTIALREAS